MTLLLGCKRALEKPTPPARSKPHGQAARPADGSRPRAASCLGAAPMSGRCDMADFGGSRDRRLSPVLARAYRRTRYCAGGVVVRLDRNSRRADALLDRLGVRAGGFVTAWNPMSRRMPEGWNRRMQHALAASVRGLPTVGGLGVGDGWTEEHLLIGAARGRLGVLARRFRQRAIVVVRIGRKARLVVV